MRDGYWGLFIRWRGTDILLWCTGNRGFIFLAFIGYALSVWVRGDFLWNKNILILLLMCLPISGYTDANLFGSPLSDRFR